MVLLKEVASSRRFIEPNAAGPGVMEAVDTCILQRRTKWERDHLRLGDRLDLSTHFWIWLRERVIGKVDVLEMLFGLGWAVAVLFRDRL